MKYDCFCDNTVQQKKSTPTKEQKTGHLDHSLKI